MNERLIVRSFGPIKETEITFKKVTLFIGDQGMGKSCIAKLFSLFKWLEKVLTQKRYQPNYFEQYNRFVTKLCSYHRIDSFIQEESYICYEGSKYNFVYDNGFRVTSIDTELEGMPKVMYIPAERSIVSVAENKPKLLKELPDSSSTFYDEFVNSKKFFQNGYDLPYENLRFEYDALNDTGWIRGNDYKVRLVNASSGIQSSLPMCMVTSYLSNVVQNREEAKLSMEEKARLEKQVADIMQNSAYSETIKDIMIRQLSASNTYDSFINVVEEPELNLFPTSQMEVMYSLVANNASSDKNMLVMTTHSPYLLAIINMMIMGSKAYSNADTEMKDEIGHILPTECHLKPEDVVAYRLDSKEETYCQSIINPKTGLISKNELDSASNIIMKMFNSLYMNYAKTVSR